MPIDDGRAGRFWPVPHSHGWTYFVQVDEDGGPIKVGKANNLTERFRALQGGNHQPLRFLGALPYREVPERVIHRLFREYFIRGEWFECHPSLLRIADLGAEHFSERYRPPEVRPFYPVSALSDALAWAVQPSDLQHILYGAQAPNSGPSSSG